MMTPILTHEKNRLEMESMILKIYAIISLFLVSVNAQVLQFEVKDYPSVIIKGLNLDIKVSGTSGNFILISGITDRSQWSFKNFVDRGLVIEQKLSENRKELISNINLPAKKLV
ncbi:MAG: hypothetical protein KDD45_08605, partial [Bdellovibrionales bacterium]|nr:hypothetical protein [Bdellovibrionales bacterium]